MSTTHTSSHHGSRPSYSFVAVGRAPAAVFACPSNGGCCPGSGRSCCPGLFEEGM